MHRTEEKVSQKALSREREQKVEAENFSRWRREVMTHGFFSVGRSLDLHSAADQVTPSRIRSARPCSHRSSAKWKAARAKRVDDERVRKCASHVGELVQSHPSSASALLTRVWSRKRADGSGARIEGKEIG